MRTPRLKRLIGACALLVAAGWSAAAFGQSTAGPGLFDAIAADATGNTISAAQCRQLEQQQTAVWVTVQGKGWCLRYYAYGLGRQNAVAAGWLHGDIGVGGGGPSGHQRGIGPASMIAQERELSLKYRTPFIFLARPGAYGSGGYFGAVRHRTLEADLVEAEIEALTVRYGIKSWVLSGHSGGASLVAEMLNRRRDIRCAIVSSSAPDINAYLKAHGNKLVRPDPLNAVTGVARMPKTPGQRIIVMGDPRDTNTLWSLQLTYADALKRHGATVTVLPLERGRPPEFHSLVSLAETAVGLCAQGQPTPKIAARLRAMPSQVYRESN